jgi:3-hydroxybutyryl-CoA dehydrogenase
VCAPKGDGFPIGPFELGDLIGLDVGLDVISYVHDELGDPYYTPRLLKELVRWQARPEDRGWLL